MPIIPTNFLSKSYGAQKGQYKKWKSRIEKALKHNNQEQLLSLIAQYHPADVADLLESLEHDLREQAFDIIVRNSNISFISDLFLEIEKDVRQKLLPRLSVDMLTKIIEPLESDAAVSLLSDIPIEERQIVLMHLPDSQKKLLEGFLFYPDYSAGRLMHREVAIVPVHYTVGQTQEYLKNNTELPEKFYELFVVDTHLSPIGSVSLSTLLNSDADTPIEQLMERNIQALPATMDQEMVTFLFRQYGLISNPVVDEYNRIIGMINLNDVLNVIEEEVAEDIMNLGRVSEFDINASVFQIAKWRLKWLMVTFLSTLTASMVVYQFQEIIEKIVALAILMPIIAAMGGNAGIQVVTITVRAIATNQLRWTNISHLVFKEIKVALINSGFFSIILIVITGIFFKDFLLSLVLVTALIFNICWACVAGFLFPILIHRLGMDPAISAGPLLTTTTDVLGFTIFLGLANLVLG